MTTGRVLSAALYLAGAWVALTVLLVQAPWAPTEAALQGARIVLVGLAWLALAVCSFGAIGALLSLVGMSVKPEAAPRPYQPPV